MRSPNLDQLRALMRVAELGSFSAAARTLHLSQPAVSLQIRELETRFGVQLLHRIGKRALPTHAGRDLIAHAGTLFEVTDRALAAMQRHKEGRAGRVHIGTGTTALTYRLPPILAALRRDHPDVELVITTGMTPDIVERIVGNVIDIGLVSLPVDERALRVIRLRKSELVAILPRATPSVPKTIAPADVAAGPLILEYERANHSRLVREWMRASGLDARPVMELDNIEAIKNVVAAGLGVSIIPAEAMGGAPVERRLVMRALRPALGYDLALVYRRNKPLDDAARVVLKALQSIAQRPRRIGSRRKPTA